MAGCESPPVMVMDSHVRVTTGARRGCCPVLDETSLSPLPRGMVGLAAASVTPRP